MNVHDIATPAGFSLFANMLNAYQAWSLLTPRQKAALRAWPTKPTDRIAENLRKKGILNAEGTLTVAGELLCWANMPGRKSEFEGWRTAADS